MLLGSCLALAACEGTDPIHPDASGGPPIDAGFEPTESRLLGLGDLSVLLALPDDPLNGTTLARMTGVPGHDGELVPRDAFGTLVTAPDDVGHAYESFHVVALRFDLCDRVAVGPCAEGADGELRLVLQPVLPGSPSTTADVALHAFYTVPASDLAAVVDELRALARLRDRSPYAAMTVDALRSTSPPSEYRTRLRRLVARYAVAGELTRLSLFARELDEDPFHWVFRAIERSGSGFTAFAIPTLGASEQRINLLLAPWPTYVATPVGDVPAGFPLALDNDGFLAATLAQRRTALGALAAAQNPTLHGFASEQCVACHVATFLADHRSRQGSGDPGPIDEVFSSSHDLSVAAGISAQTDSSLRAFGYHHQNPAISQRVANETAVVLDEIDARFPPAAPMVFPDAAIPDARPMVKRVFVASAPHTGDLRTAGGGRDGLDGADRLCAAAAEAGGLGGEWVAWLSTSAVDAIDRITGDGPWYLVDSTTRVFATKAAIAAGPEVPIDLDEHGTQPPDAENVWTGTAPDGTGLATDHTCADWTSAGSDGGMIGRRTATDDAWTAYTDVLCAGGYGRLYCFEQ
jgi:hypothetical protein